ncbi:MAG TPA: hypothetical protein P5323_00485 [Candidatus Moranbacteria bacterium]|nr:hypothetical protein [Candidatus Moranbacteria bacterium]HRY27593.1 hypothetical protein [Candidatus Moranbacteria bacterium]HSA07822.1 hypothetical protein [Candidatus Moranbacteria bacterium]
MSEKIPNQREVFLKDGNLEPENLAMEREKRFIKDWIERFGGRNLPEWEEFFKKIDFSLLQNLFSKLENRCGVTKNRTNFLGPESILSADGCSSKYFSEYNLITLGSVNRQWPLNDKTEDKEKSNKYLERTKEAYGSADICRLHNLIHEETHAISKNVCIGWEQSFIYPENPARGEMGQEQSGYYNSSRYGNLPYEGYGGNAFNTLNEAVAEKISREITLEYIAFSNWPKDEVKKFEESYKQGSLLHYKQEVIMLNAIIRKISENNKISEQTIWDALKKGFIKGERFESHEVVKLFEESFGSEFLNDLSKVEMERWIKEDFDNFVKKYNLI